MAQYRKTGWGLYLFMSLTTLVVASAIFLIYKSQTSADVFTSKISISSRQKSLAEEISKDILLVREKLRNKEDVAQDLSNIKILRSQWENGQKALLNGDELYGTSSENSYEVQQLLQTVGPKFVENCDALNAMIQDPTLINDKSVMVFLGNQEMFMATMRDATGQFMTQSDSNSKRLETYSLILAAVALLALVFGFLFLVKPLLRNVRVAQESEKNVELEIEKVNKVKTEFLANMSHEIRTPLNGVIGMTELLSKTKLDQDQRDYVRNVHGSALNLLDIVNDLLDYSQIESGNLEIMKERFVLSDCVEQVIDLMKPLAIGKSIEIMSEIDPEIPAELFQDERRVRQVLLNLVNNAIKFTEKGEILIRVEFLNREADFVQMKFSVSDTGIGIAPDVMPKLFQSFSQADSSISKRYGGSGLGLAISKSLVQEMGGRIWLESQLGKGSTFYFTLVAEASGQSQRLKINALNGLRALVVDDNKTNLKILIRQLSAWGVQATPFNSPDLVSEILDNVHKFDFCIIDMQMPEMDGKALAQKIRARHSIEKLPIIVLSSIGQHLLEDHSHLYSAYLTKPVRQSKLLDTIILVMGLNPIDNAKRAMPTGNEEVSPMKLKILIAEDNELTRAVAAKTLQLLGHKFTSVSTGQEVIDLAKRDDYDLILMDVDLPEMDGVETVKRLKKINGRNEMPVIFGISEDSSKDKKICLQAGMDDLVDKPLNAEVLQSKIQFWFEENK
jgi:signal transduction histidine kinase/CheY-like chemotaxis protein